MMSNMGNRDIASWASRPSDPVLGELYDHYHYRKDTLNASDSAARAWAQHDWMANNLDKLAGSLKDFVAANYPTTYTNVGSSIDPYLAFFYISDAEAAKNNTRFGGEIFSDLGGDQSVIDRYYVSLFLNTNECSN